MKDVRYVGIDPKLMPPELGPAVVRVAPDGVSATAYIDRTQIDPALMRMMPDMEEIIVSQLIARPTPQPMAPWRRVRIERVPGMLWRPRLLRPELTPLGMILRVPASHISPALAGAINVLGTHVLTNYDLPV